MSIRDYIKRAYAPICVQVRLSEKEQAQVRARAHSYLGDIALDYSYVTDDERLRIQRAIDRCDRQRWGFEE